MSHFTVLVMGENVTNQDVLERLMKPYHEFECTGINEYVEEVDKTEDARSTYENAKKKFIFLADGTRLDPWNDTDMATIYRAATSEEIDRIENGRGDGLEYKRTPDKGGYIYTIQDLPAGAEEREVEVKSYQSFEDWVADYYGNEIVTNPDDIDLEGAHKYGYILKTYGGMGGEDMIKVINRTNPNAKWDWYVVGGRWSGMLRLKPGAESGVQGRPSWGMEQPGQEEFDGAKKSDIDFDILRINAMNGRREAWTKIMEKMRTVYPDATDEALDALRYNVSKRKEELTAKWEADGRPGRLWDELAKVVSEDEYKIMTMLFGWFDGMSETQAAFEKIEDWIAAAAPLTTYAMMIDGKWISRGDMGWWGMSSNESDPNEWEDQVMRAINALPDDHELVYVDCHI